jgi:hypothetical protein
MQEIVAKRQEKEQTRYDSSNEEEESSESV